MILIGEPFPVHAFDQVYEWSLASWKHVANDDTPKDYEGWLQVQMNIVSRPSVRTWAVWRDGELGGYVWADIDKWIARAHVIFKRSFWGRATTDAVKRITSAAFKEGIVKIELWMWVDNLPARAMARRIGAVEEGILTAQGKRDGKLMDCAVYGLYADGETQPIKLDWADWRQSGDVRRRISQ